MPRTLSEQANRFRQRLTRLDQQPIGKAALTVILFLDLFILNAIFDGLADHTSQLPSPEDHIPTLCREIVLDAEWNPTNRLGHLARLVTAYHDLPYTHFERPDAPPPRPLCARVIDAYKAVRDDDKLARDLRQIRLLSRETLDVRDETERMKGAYDTQLLDRIAKEPRAPADTESLHDAMASKTTDLDELARKEGELKAAIQADPKVIDLFARVAGVSEAERIALRDELRRLNFWYPVQRLGMEMLFLLPLLAVFYLWNARAIARERPFQTLVSSHLLVVTMIPVFFKVLQLVYDIIPHRLIRQLIELLQAFKLVAIWHYLVMALAIGAAMALVYLFQKKLFSPEKIWQRRIAKGLCQDCGQRLPPGSRHCPACGAAQFKACGHCGQDTHAHGRFCQACGQAQSE